MNVLSVLKLFQLSNGDLLFSLLVYSIYKVCDPRMTKLGQGVEVRAHYPKVGLHFLFCFTSQSLRLTVIVPAGHKDQKETVPGVMSKIVQALMVQGARMMVLTPPPPHMTAYHSVLQSH